MPYMTNYHRNSTGRSVLTTDGRPAAGRKRRNTAPAKKLLQEKPRRTVLQQTIITIATHALARSQTSILYIRRHTVAQRRRSVVKSGGQGHSGQAIKLEADRNSLLFSVPKMGYLAIFAFFCFRLKMNFHFIFRFRSKSVICVVPKILHSQLNHN